MKNNILFPLFVLGLSFFGLNCGDKDFDPVKAKKLLNKTALSEEQKIVLKNFGDKEIKNLSFSQKDQVATIIANNLASYEVKGGLKFWCHNTASIFPSKDQCEKAQKTCLTTLSRQSRKNLNKKQAEIKAERDNFKNMALPFLNELDVTGYDLTQFLDLSMDSYHVVVDATCSDADRALVLEKRQNLQKAYGIHPNKYTKLSIMYGHLTTKLLAIISL